VLHRRCTPRGEALGILRHFHPLKGLVVVVVQGVIVVLHLVRVVVVASASAAASAAAAVAEVFAASVGALTAPALLLGLFAKLLELEAVLSVVGVHVVEDAERALAMLA
jgi:hypothetical protein